MIKKIFFILVFIIILKFNSFADWKTDLSSYFDIRKDYKGAVDYLKSNFGASEEISLPIFTGLLAFSYNKLNNKNEEYKWLSEYFENYRGRDTIFSFLGEITYEEIASYLKLWKGKYPLVTGVAFIKEDSTNEFTPPSKLKIGVNIRNEAYYKFSDKEKTIQAGLFGKGLNLLGLELLPLLEKSGLYAYFLDLKTDDLILKKEVGIDIKLDSDEVVKRSKVKINNNEFAVSMLTGNKLFVSKKGAPEKFFSIDIKKLLEPLPPGYRAYTPNAPQSDYRMRGITIDLIKVYNLIKKYKDKEKTEKISAELKKISQIEITFKKNMEGVEKEVRAVISLKMRNLSSSCVKP
ncbi:MAG: hypothetical protein AB1410_08085 [Acidobacteriota bacterium]